MIHRLSGIYEVHLRVSGMNQAEGYRSVGRLWSRTGVLLKCPAAAFSSLSRFASINNTFLALSLHKPCFDYLSVYTWLRVSSPTISAPKDSLLLKIHTRRCPRLTIRPGTGLTRLTSPRSIPTPSSLPSAL